MSGNKPSGMPRQAGFTLVELMISVSVMAIVGVTFLALISNYFVVITRNNELAEMTINAQNLLRTTVENIRFGNGVSQSNLISDPHAPTGGWNTSNTNFVIVLEVPAETTGRTYIIDPSTGSPYMNELVYYKSGTTLMERKLANPSATGDSLVTTCPASAASTACPADPTLATYVNTMTFTMYDQDANQTTTPSAARSIYITLNMQRNAPGEPLNLTTTTRVTLRNRF